MKDRLSTVTLGIVIVNYNSGDYLRLCLNSIVQSHHMNYSLVTVIIVDNMSSDHSLDDIQAVCLPIHVMREPKNIGFSRACNKGAQQLPTSVDYILFLNPDTQLYPDTLDKTLSVMLRNPVIGVCGPKIVDFNSSLAKTCDCVPTSFFDFLPQCLGLGNILRFGLFNHRFDHEYSRSVDHLMGSYYLIRYSLFFQLSGFDERFFVYYEDIDLSRRVSHAGFILYFFSQAVLRHYGGGCSEKTKAFRLAFHLQSRYRYIDKYMGKKQAIIFLILSCLVELPLRAFRELLALDAKAFGQVLKGYFLFLLKRVP